MKTMFKLLGIIVLVAIVGFSFAACGDPPDVGGGEEESTQTSAPVITISTQPTQTTHVTAGSITGSLTVAASVTQSATLSYQWYSNTSNSNTGGTAVSGATNASFPIPTVLSIGTYYYFVEVRATGGATSVRSNVATVSVSVSAPSTIVPGANLDAKFLWLRTNATNNQAYTIVLTENHESVENSSLPSGRSNVTIELVSTTGEKRITPGTAFSLFNIGSGITVVLNNDITLEGRTSGNNSSMVIINSGGSFIMNEGSKIIDHNGSAEGGGVNINGGTFTMWGGVISGNSTFASSTRSRGAGVYMQNGFFYMHGGEITANDIRNNMVNFVEGAGVYVRNGTFTMTGGDIHGNTGGAWNGFNGAGVYLYNGTFNMEGGQIRDNIVGTGPSVMGGGVYVAGGTFTIDGGHIFGNRAGLGSGVYQAGGTVNMVDGRIGSNNGTGVHIASGTFTMIDGEISNNRQGVNVASDGKFIMKNGKINNNTTVTGADIAHGIGVSVIGEFTMENGEISSNTRTTSSTDVYGGGVFVGFNGIFNMITGKITNNTATTGGGLYVGGGTFTMTDGEISGNQISGINSFGAGVNVSTGTFIMKSGQITDNTILGTNVDNHGGGVYVSGVSVPGGQGLFTMEGGNISRNTASGNGGGVYVSSFSSFLKTNGIIHGTNDMTNRNRAMAGDVNGHTAFVYVNSTTVRRRENTSLSIHTLDSTVAGVPGGWEN